ncbi:MAG: peptidase M20 [Anaerolineaceae bacterium]|nr:peptidase M20 [Anaerolineaceae bacterium]
MTNVYDYAQNNRDRFLQQLIELVRIPSVGTDPARRADTLRAAEWIADDMRRIGLNNVAILPTEGNPAVYADWLEAGDQAPTVLIYAHYDVQPAELSDGWDSDPFEPTERNGVLYGRGIADDKSNVIITLKAAESLLASEEGCPVNLKFLFEGEEEGGSPNLPGFIRDYKDRLQADMAIIADGGLEKPDEPMIIYAMRGIVAFEVRITGPITDLHSGVHGGSVHNPAQVIAEMVAKLHNEDGSIAVPGFYDDVENLDDAERAEVQKSDMSQQEWDQNVGAPKDWGEPGYSLAERTGSRPTLEINGIYGGYIGDGFKTVIPSKAMAKISCRLVANQKPDKIYEMVTSYIRQIAPPTVHVEFQKHGDGAPIRVPLDSPIVQALSRAFKLHWTQEAAYKRTGGSIPIVAVLQDELNLPCVPLGFSLADSGIHGPNENYHVDMFHKGVDTTIRFLQEIAAASS